MRLTFKSFRSKFQLNQIFSEIQRYLEKGFAWKNTSSPNLCWPSEVGGGGQKSERNLFTLTNITANIFFWCERGSSKVCFVGFSPIAEDLNHDQCWYFASPLLTGRFVDSKKTSFPQLLKKLVRWKSTLLLPCVDERIDVVFNYLETNVSRFLEAKWLWVFVELKGKWWGHFLVRVWGGRTIFRKWKGSFRLTWKIPKRQLFSVS